MPASVAHMLLFEDVVSRISVDKDCEELSTIFKDSTNLKYGRLGSMGPDLPYYSGNIKTLSSLLFSLSDRPANLEQWSGQLHSKDPNIFPLKMIEIAWRETDLKAVEWDDISKKQWAFIMGFLTHIAADQIIHPYVNSIVGQYYRENDNRKRHRDCEVYQDIVLFSNKRNKSLLSEKLTDWIASSLESKCTEPYFRVFLQKAFIEAHAIYPSETEIDNWVSVLLTFFLYLKFVGPYKSADKDFQNNKENSEQYKKYWLNAGNAGGKPYQDYYNEAVELAYIYVKTAYQLFKVNYDDFSDNQRQYFLSVVRNADLTNPLDKNILADAKENYERCFGKV